MGFQEDFRAAIVRRVNDDRWRTEDHITWRTEDHITAEDIEDISVDWDDGDRYDPTYPGDNEAPTFTVSVKLRGELIPRTLPTACTFTALLRAVLALD